MAKICYGEFDWPNQRAKQSYLRERFLMAVACHKNEVWQELYDVLPSYMSLTETKEPFDQKNLDEFWSSPESSALMVATFPSFGGLSENAFVSEMGNYRESRLHWSTVYSVYKHLSAKSTKSLAGIARRHEYEKEILLLVEALKRWARKWNLDTDWCLESAYNTLGMWSVLDEKPGRLMPDTESIGGGVPTGPEPPDGLPLFLPTDLSREDYIESVRSQNPRHGTLKRVEAYCLEVEQCYERAGYRRCKAGEKRNLEQHLEWAVRFQVCGESLEYIANIAGDASAGGVEKSTVLRPVSELRQLIGLEKRADAKRGRRRGSKNKDIGKTRRELAR